MKIRLDSNISCRTVLISHVPAINQLKVSIGHVTELRRRVITTNHHTLTSPYSGTVDSYEDTLRIASIRSTSSLQFPPLKLSVLTLRHSSALLQVRVIRASSYCPSAFDSFESLEEGLGGSLQHTLLGDGCH